MYFNNINIKGFRGIKELELDDCGQINLIVGQNNTCKTSILEAIFLLVGISNPELVIRINNFRDLLITEESDFRFVFHNLDYSNELKIRAELGKNAFRELQIKPQLKEKNGANQTTTLNTVEDKDKQSNVYKFDTSPTDSSVINELLFDFKIKEFHSSKSDFKAKLKLEGNKISFQEPKNYKEKLKGVYVTQKISMSQNLEKELEEIIINKKIDEIIEILNIIDKNILGISFGANRMIYFDIGINRLVPINLTGDGVRRLLTLILALYNAKDGILFIDEIENGLHFSVLESFWKVIYQAAKKFNVQVFATTHNIESLKFLNDAGLKSNGDFRDSVRSYTIRQTKNKELKAIKYNFEKFNFSIEQGIEIR